MDVEGNAFNDCENLVVEICVCRFCASFVRSIVAKREFLKERILVDRD